MRSLSLIGLALPLAACGARSTSDSLNVTRDSAGVRIVESFTDTRLDAAWIIGEDATWSVGEVEGDPNYLLSRVVGAMKVPSGEIVVANGGSNQLRRSESVRPCDGKEYPYHGRGTEAPRMIKSKLTSKSQTTIPKPVRTALHLEEGDEIVYEIVDGERAVLSKARSAAAEDPFATFDEWAGDADRDAYADL